MSGEQSEPISRDALGTAENLDHTVNFTDFESDVTLDDWVTRFNPAQFGVPPIFFLPIDTLTPVHPVGAGRTNTTLIMPTIVQTDSNPSFASFDQTVNTSRAPAVSIHFEAAGYGITTTGGYVFSFGLQTSGPETFDASGYAESGTVTNPGPKTINGKKIITVVLANVPPGPVWVALTQTAGAAFSWYYTSISHPPLVFQP